MGAIDRVLDANMNRAAEGMRVLEDISRFVLDNKTLCGAIKKHRHELRSQRVGVDSRDTAGDVGTSVSTIQEENRNSLHDVATASGNRCAEALRVIEEFLKLESKQNTIEAIRYAMYDLSSEVISLLGAITKKQWNLCFVMTKDDCVLAWKDTLVQSIVAGCDCVQVREKNMTTRELIKHVNEVKEIAELHSIQVIVNDRVDVALATRVSGVHIGVDDISIQDARILCGSEYIIGVTAHKPEEVNALISSGADYVGVGAMFASPTKPHVRVAPLGLLKNALPYHHLAIGGITPENVHELYKIGCRGVAVSSAIANSHTPDKVVLQLLQPEHQSA